MRTDLDTILTPGKTTEPMRKAAAGSITKSDGTEGHVLVKLAPDCDMDVFEDDFLFVEVNGGIVPMRMTDVKRRGDRSATIALGNIATESQAKALVGCKVYGTPDDSEYDDDDDDLDMASLTGYTVIDEAAGEIGVIQDIDDSVAANPLLVVSTPEGETLIPAADEFVVDVDDENQVITLRLPDGLLNIDDAPEA